jgi:hypothetical protein
MKKSDRRSIHDLFHDHYSGTGSAASWIEYIDRGARVMLDRTTIVPNLQRAKILLDVLDVLQTGDHHDNELELQRVFDVFSLLTDCFEPIADDVLIISALEIHAKAELLRKGYVIHEIRQPSRLRKQQKEKPVHVRTVRAAIRKGEQVVFNQGTLGIGLLLIDKYLKHYPVPPTAVAALAEVRRRRNFVHFPDPYGYGVDRGLLQLVQHLHTVIPPIKIRRRRSPRRRGA